MEATGKRVYWILVINVLYFTEATQSRESLPEIVMDHERPAVEGPTSVQYSDVVQRETSTQKTETDEDIPSPTNEYDYVLHKVIRQQQQQQLPGHASPVSVSSVSA